MIQRSWVEEHPQRYYPFSQFLRERFPCRVQKIPIHAGFTCPNRDGSAGVGGCTYCANESFSPNARGKSIPIREQVKSGIKFLSNRYGAEKFIVYFQAFTNTYADVNTLKAKYDEALEEKDVVGISIGTRPDCVPPDTLELISSYTKDYHVWIEYGLQSIHDHTLELVNRGHSFKAFEDAISRTKDTGIYICVHVILGLPGEDWEDMMETAHTISAMGIDGIKLHHLYIAKNTPLAEEYFKGNVRTMSAEEYVRIAADFIERLSPDISIQRLVGDTRGKFLISPIWQMSKADVCAAITAELRRRDSYQGAKRIKTQDSRPKTRMRA
jgi:hypothetical protein